MTGRKRPVYRPVRLWDEGVPPSRYRASARQARVRAIALRRGRPAFAPSRFGAAGPRSRQARLLALPPRLFFSLRLAPLVEAVAQAGPHLDAGRRGGDALVATLAKEHHP